MNQWLEPRFFLSYRMGTRTLYFGNHGFSKPWFFESQDGPNNHTQHTQEQLSLSLSLSLEKDSYSHYVRRESKYQVSTHYQNIRTVYVVALQYRTVVFLCSPLLWQLLAFGFLVFSGLPFFSRKIGTNTCCYVISSKANSRYTLQIQSEH